MSERLERDGVDQRRSGLSRWCARALKSGNGTPLQPLTGDAGFRRYFRTGSRPSMIAVDSPPEFTDPQRFVAVADYLRRHGIHTPMVAAADTEQGFMLLEDLGDTQLFARLDGDSVAGLYGEVLNELLCLQQIPAQEDLFPPYSRELLLNEMRILPEWLAEKMLGYRLEAADLSLLEDTFALLLDSAEEQPRVLVHRDYHSRNLMLRDGERPGVVDFQDAVWGPVTYDLVSLLRDCYVRWPQDRVQRWALCYAVNAEVAGIMEAVPAQRFLRWFDWMGLQRHIKVLGLFPRLHLRDGKDSYLPYLPLVIRYALEVADRYPELRPFAEWFRSRLLPLLEHRHWYRDYRSAGDTGRQMYGVTQ
ncbi:aminoglycoside phosphotransferase family protein [Microbulbifer sp. 2201CG32-9]|uniref:aminoglycoside phosphotransferase family protein n=1 Tax=Microbulbifer sp. 2201CG32-9 TaxID=3232309 RepID=UPI00345C312D